MKVAVIGCGPSEIISACRNTISMLAKQGHKIYAIIAPLDASELSSSSSSSLSLSLSEIAKGHKLLTEVGVTQVFLIETFDYSAITQTNADAVNLHIKHVKPSLVIMPSWKSPNYMRRILARVSLIACRGIGTILMYEFDTNNRDFVPNIIFKASAEPPSIQCKNNTVQTSTSTDQDGIDIKKKAFINNSLLENKSSKAISCEVEEKFQSHRTLLLEEDGSF